MPTLGDLLQWAAKTFGEGVLHKNAIETRGGDYRLKEQAAHGAQMDAATRRAMLLAEVERGRIGRSAAAAQARSEFPDATAGVEGDDALAARLPLLVGEQARGLEQALKMTQIETEEAQQDELGQRHRPKPMNPEEVAKLEAEIERIRAEAGRAKAQEGFYNRRPGSAPPRPQRQPTGLDIAKFRLQAERAGMTPKEIEEMVAEIGSPVVGSANMMQGSPIPSVGKGAPAAAAAPKEVSSRQQFDQLPVGAKFTRGGRPCVKVSASDMDCQ
jgi:hypothetical protein